MTAIITDEPEGPKPKRSKRILIGLLLFLLLVLGSLYWLHARHFEGTDDAAVDGHFAALSTRISGTVISINPDIEDDRYVTAGALLLKLDPRDLEAELEHAKATLQTKEADAQAANLQISITDASAYSQLRLVQASRKEALESVGAAQSELSSAQHRVLLDQAVASRTERDRARYLVLVEKREISRSFYDERDTEATTATQTLASDRAATVGAQQKIEQLNSLVLQRDAQVTNAHTAPQQVSNARALAASAQGSLNEARADVRTAQLNLEYTTIYAPVSGIVGHKTVQLGHRVQPGQTLLTVVPIDDIWITANYKETQLRLMHPGQPVKIHVDSMGRDLTGEIEDMAGASGPLFSLFPPENASGNYVKIVQRFPVRIRLDNAQDTQHLLRPGMSVEATVRVR
jgi:membrane fusion protein (multidrug efflux system)